MLFSALQQAKLFRFFVKEDNTIGRYMYHRYPFFILSFHIPLGSLFCGQAVQSDSTSLWASWVSLLPEGESGNAATRVVPQDRYISSSTPKLLKSFISSCTLYLSLLHHRCRCGLLVSFGLWNHHREIRERHPRNLQGLDEGAGWPPAMCTNPSVIGIQLVQRHNTKSNPSNCTCLPAIPVVEGENHEWGWKKTASQAKGTGSYSGEARMYVTTAGHRWGGNSNDFSDTQSFYKEGNRYLFDSNMFSFPITQHFNLNSLWYSVSSVAWCLRNEGVSSVLLGTSNPRQLTENLGAIQVLTPFPTNE